VTEAGTAGRGSSLFVLKSLEAAVGLEPTKTGFADQRLDRFGIAASEKLYPESIPKTVPKLPFIPPIYPYSSLRKLLKPR
jgi:hypothetical protein